MSISRRNFGKLTAAAGLGASVGVSAMATPAHAAVRKSRRHGPLLTDGYGVWQTAIANGHHDLAKVVTAWGVPGGTFETKPDFAWTAAGLTEYLIVRTESGDTVRMLEPDTAVDQVRRSRLYEYKKIQKGADKCIIEIGNEPNGGGLNVDAYAAALSSTVDKMRNAFPGARICSTALSPNNFLGTTDSRFPRNWMRNANWRAAVAKCDFVGVHFYCDDANWRWNYQGQANEMWHQEILDLVGQYWPGKPAIATEYGIRTWRPEWGPRPAPSIQRDMGSNYANLMHYDLAVRDNLWGATYYHVMSGSWPDSNQDVGSEGAIGYWRKYQGY